MAHINKYHDNNDDSETTDALAQHEEHDDYESDDYVSDSSDEDNGSVNGIEDIQRECSRISLGKTIALDNRTFFHQVLYAISEDPVDLESPVPEEPPKLPILPVVPKRVSGSAKSIPKSKKNSAAINRKRQQEKIDQDNLALLRKIQSIKPFGLSKPSSFIRQKFQP